jgi:hypothetical protein
MNRLLLTAALMTVSPALAQTQVPGTKVVYFTQKDPITDENKSVVAVAEVNDTDANTFLRFRCIAGAVDVILFTKNPLVTLTDWENDVSPQLIYRVDAQQPKTLITNGIVSDDEPVLTALGLENDNVLVQAFTNATSKVVIRIVRRDMSPLDYTFATKGFAQAMKAVNSCR